MICQTCSRTDCNGHCAKPTDIDAIEEQHRLNCAALDDDANPRRQGECYFELVKEALNQSLRGVSVSHATLERVRPYIIDAVIAGHKAACGAVDYIEQLKQEDN